MRVPDPLIRTPARFAVHPIETEDVSTGDRRRAVEVQTWGTAVCGRGASRILTGDGLEGELASEPICIDPPPFGGIDRRRNA